MKNSNFIKGIQILTKYLDPDEYSLAAEHDQFWVCCDASETPLEDKKKLEKLGWFITEDDVWSAFV